MILGDIWDARSLDYGANHAAKSAWYIPKSQFRTVQTCAMVAVRGPDLPATRTRKKKLSTTEPVDPSLT